MTTPATEAAQAAEASAEAAEAAAEAAETEAETEETEEAGDGEGGDTTVVVVDGEGEGEGAHDDEVQLDHEQRITRLEERHDQLAAQLFDRPSREEVSSMIPDYSTIIETARTEAAAVAEATAEAVDEAEETGEPASVRIEEPPSTAGDIVTVSPEVPEAAEENGPRRRGIFRW